MRLRSASSGCGLLGRPQKKLLWRAESFRKLIFATNVFQLSMKWEGTVPSWQNTWMPFQLWPLMETPPSRKSATPRGLTPSTSSAILSRETCPGLGSSLGWPSSPCGTGAQTRYPCCWTWDERGSGPGCCRASCLYLIFFLFQITTSWLALYKVESVGKSVWIEFEVHPKTWPSVFFFLSFRPCSLLASDTLTFICSKLRGLKGSPVELSGSPQLVILEK